MPERFLWRAPFWSNDLGFAILPLALLVPIIGRRIDGRPLPILAEAVFVIVAVVFCVGLLRAHLRPRYSLALDDEGIRAEIPGALIGRHPWSLAWDAIRRAAIVSGPEYRTLVFEPIGPRRDSEHYAAILTGLGTTLDDEPALLAALARRGFPVAETPPPIDVTSEREFVLYGPRDRMTRFTVGALAVALFTFPVMSFVDFLKREGLMRLVGLAFGIGMFVWGALSWWRIMRTRLVLRVGPEGIALIRRSPGQIGQPPTEQTTWGLAWDDVTGIEVKNDVLVFRTEIAPRPVVFGAPPKAGIIDPDGLLALLASHGLHLPDPP